MFSFLRILTALLLFFTGTAAWAAEEIPDPQVVKAALEKSDYPSLQALHDTLLAQVKKDPEDESLFNYYKDLATVENIPRLKKWSQHDQDSYIPWTALGDALIKKGWEYRGTDVSSKVPKDMWKPFKDCLAEAQIYLEKAEAMKADDPYPYNFLMVIGKTQCRAKFIMKKYLVEALQACPGNGDAKLTIAVYYSPMWCGSAEDMSQFVAEYGKTAPPGAWARLLTVVYHQEILKTKKWSVAYISKPEVWGDVSREFKTYLTHHPEDLSARSWYSYWAYWSKHYKEAKEQFDILGDHWQSNNGYWSEKAFKEAKARTEIRLR